MTWELTSRTEKDSLHVKALGSEKGVPLLYQVTEVQVGLGKQILEARTLKPGPSKVQEARF